MRKFLIGSTCVTFLLSIYLLITESSVRYVEFAATVLSILFIFYGTTREEKRGTDEEERGKRMPYTPKGESPYRRINVVAAMTLLLIGWLVVGLRMELRTESTEIAWGKALAHLFGMVLYLFMVNVYEMRKAPAMAGKPLTSLLRLSQYRFCLSQIVWTVFISSSLYPFNFNSAYLEKYSSVSYWVLLLLTVAGTVLVGVMSDIMLEKAREITARKNREPLQAVG